MNNEDGSEQLVCEACAKERTDCHGCCNSFKLVDGAEYSIFETGIKRHMTKTFSNLKISLARHLQTHVHKRALETFMKEKIQVESARQNIVNEMCHFSYY